MCKRNPLDNESYTRGRSEKRAGPQFVTSDEWFVTGDHASGTIFAKCSPATVAEWLSSIRSSSSAEA
jgi:hypothetical protein